MSARCLLSIGLLADTDAALYLEFTDGWQESACSAWVRQHILPTLGQGERLTRRAAGQRIFDWLQLFDTPLTLLANNRATSQRTVWHRTMP